MVAGRYSAEADVVTRMKMAVTATENARASSGSTIPRPALENLFWKGEDA